jgi:hypothetical protein
MIRETKISIYLRHFKSRPSDSAYPNHSTPDLQLPIPLLRPPICSSLAKFSVPLYTGCCFAPKESTYCCLRSALTARGARAPLATRLARCFVVRDARWFGRGWNGRDAFYIWLVLLRVLFVEVGYLDAHFGRY